MGKKIGIFYIIIGLVVFILSFFFDFFGGYPGFGKYQLIGLIFGLILVAVGLKLKIPKKEAKA